MGESFIEKALADLDIPQLKSILKGKYSLKFFQNKLFLMHARSYIYFFGFFYLICIFYLLIMIL